MNEDESWDNDDAIQTDSSERCSGTRITHWPRPQELTGIEMKISPIRKPNSRMVIRRYSVQKPANVKSKEQRQQDVQAVVENGTDTSQSKATISPQQVISSLPSPQKVRMVNLETLRALESEPLQTQDKCQRGITEKEKEVTRGHECFGQPLRISKRLPSINDRTLPIRTCNPSTDIEGKGYTRSQFIPSNVPAANQRQGRHKRNKEILQMPKMTIDSMDKSFWSPSSDGSYTPYTTDHHEINSYLGTGSMADDRHPIPLSLSEDESQGVIIEKRFNASSSVDRSDQREKNASKSELLQVIPTPRICEDEKQATIKKAGECKPAPVVSHKKYLRVDTTATHRNSQGWWNYITTPFLSPSNSSADPEREFLTRLRNHSPEAAVAGVEQGYIAKERGQSWGSKHLPLTPISHSSDPWWYLNPSPNKNLKIQEVRKQVQTSSAETFSYAHSEAAAGFESDGTASILSDRQSCRRKQYYQNQNQNPDLIDSEVRKKGCPTNKLTNKSSKYSFPKIMNAIRESRNKNLKSIIFNITPSDQILLSESQASLVSVRKQKIVTPAACYLWPSSSRDSFAAEPLDRDLQRPRILPRNRISRKDVLLVGPSPVKLNHRIRSLVSSNKPSNIEFYPDTHITNKIKQRAKNKQRRYPKNYNVTPRDGGWRQIRDFVLERCYCIRGVADNRKKQDWIMISILIVCLMIILAVLLSKKLHEIPRTDKPQSHWLNLTNFPPIPLGVSTIISPVAIRETSACVFPSTKWSCHLPKEIQLTTIPSPSNQPNFFFKIELKNDTLADSKLTDITDRRIKSSNTSLNNVSALGMLRYVFLKAQKSKPIQSEPAAPSFEEQKFLGRTTDGIVSDQKAGELSPFYISFFQSLKSAIMKREISVKVQSLENGFPNISSIIPAPSLRYDGTAAPANLLPFPSYQPLRLYDRGLPTEHYGFYSFFDRSIFLSIIDANKSTSTENETVPDDSNGGAREDEALFRCTWSQTRFFFQIWTQKNNSSQLNGSQCQTLNSEPAADMRQPGSFQYPTTITLDRHGGNPSTKMLYCYEMNNRMELISSTGLINYEDRGYGGILVNPAPTAFRNVSNPNLGGFDGGTSGCDCKWSNFQEVK